MFSRAAPAVALLLCCAGGCSSPTSEAPVTPAALSGAPRGTTTPPASDLSSSPTSASSASPSPPPKSTDPHWRELTSPPASLAIDGRVEEWQSAGAVRRGWVALQKDQLVVALLAPAGASKVEITLHVGPRAVSPTPRILSGSVRADRQCDGFSGGALATCEKALLAQGEAIGKLWDRTALTYGVEGTTVTVDGKPARLSKGALSNGASGTWVELQIPLAELPLMLRSMAKTVGLRVRAAGETKMPPFVELTWKEPVPMAGEKGILADAVLAILEQLDTTLFAALDASGPEPLLRGLQLPPGSARNPDQRAKEATAALTATKVETKAGDLELLRYDLLGVPAIATRKAGQIIAAFGVRGGSRGAFSRFVARGDVVDVGWDDVEEGPMAGTELVFFGVARAEASGLITTRFAGEDAMLTPGSTRTFDADLSRFVLRGRFFTGMEVTFVQSSISFRYDPKTRTYPRSDLTP